MPRQRIPLLEEPCDELKRTTEWTTFETLTTQRRLYQPSPDQCTTEGGEVREEKIGVKFVLFLVFFRTSYARMYMCTIPEREGERDRSRRERRQEMSKRLEVVDQSQSEQRQGGLELKRNHPNRRKGDKNNNGRQSKKLLYRERERIVSHF